MLFLRHTRMTAARIASSLELPRSTVARVLKRRHRITGNRTRRRRGAGWDFVHVAIDDASRLAYERFIQTLLRKWAYVRPYQTSGIRARTLPLFLHYYNRERPHGSLSGQPPISRTKARA